jgi:ABC-2 type transport system permease protein
MKSIVFREIKSFFGSPIGYLVIAIFLVGNGLFLWVFEGEYNILKSGFADLNPFFKLSPWILIFLIPAVTMRSFSEEKKQGTLELLLTKPLSIWQIVNGKFLGALALIVMSIIPTFIYVWVVSDLGATEGNIDMGSTIGSYFGLLFLVASYCAIGIFTSTLSENQIVAFILSVFLCFFFYFGFESLSKTFPIVQGFISSIGMQDHYGSMSRGVIDSRDVVYFASVSFLFLSLTVYNLKSIK